MQRLVIIKLISTIKTILVIIVLIQKVILILNIRDLHRARLIDIY